MLSTKEHPRSDSTTASTWSSCYNFPYVFKPAATRRAHRDHGGGVYERFPATVKIGNSPHADAELPPKPGRSVGAGTVLQHGGSPDLHQLGG